jgi:hypothetical protein
VSKKCRARHDPQSHSMHAEMHMIQEACVQCCFDGKPPSRRDDQHLLINARQISCWHQCWHCVDCTCTPSLTQLMRHALTPSAVLLAPG